MHRISAILLLLSLVVPGLLGSIHEIEHPLSDLQTDATHSVAAAECDRRTTVHIEAAEIVEGERCTICVLQSKTRVLLDRRASTVGSNPSAGADSIVPTGFRETTIVRLHPSRAPPRA